jgi:phosphoenolpyruvate carboxylase
MQDCIAEQAALEPTGMIALATSMWLALRAAFATPGKAVLRHYLEAVNVLGAELSLSGSLAAITPELKALADGSGGAVRW